MGKRGVGASVQKKAAQEAKAKRRRLPWKQKGLTRPERMIKFIQWLPITKGIRRGKRYRLLDDQKEFIENVYGERPIPVELAIKSAPKGNGKTGFVVGLVAAHMFGPEAVGRGEIYSAAKDRTQAGIIFKELEALIMAVPEFAAVCNIQRFKKTVEITDPTADGAGTTYEALSSDASKAHGLAPTLWIYDELAQVQSRELLDNLMNSKGKQLHTLGIVISTQAATDDHPLSQLIDDALLGEDPATYLQLICAPEDAEPFSLDVLKACNPAFGKFLDLDQVSRDMDRARRSPSFEPSYRNLRLNQRIDSEADKRVISPIVFKKMAVDMPDHDFEGRTGYGGLDLSGSKDLTSCVFVFPDGGDDPSYDILPLFWTPEASMSERRPREQEMYKRWMEAGWLRPVPGPIIRYNFIAAELAKRNQKYDIKGIAFDRWRIEQLKVELDEQSCDVPLINHGQGFKDMSPAIENFVDLALSGKLRHFGNPVLQAAVAAAITVQDPAGNMKIDKGRSNLLSTVRIDGFIALIMALHIAKKGVEEAVSNNEITSEKIKQRGGFL